MECTSLDIKVCLFDIDGEGCSDAGGGCAACCRLVLDFAQGCGADTVVALEEVVQVPSSGEMGVKGLPHVFRFFGEEGY